MSTAPPVEEFKIHPKFLVLYPQIAFPDQPDPYRYKVFYGGRCGLKSWACAQAIIVRGGTEKLKVLCAREIQKAIRESVYTLLIDTIHRMNSEKFWDILADRIVHKQTGTVINFIGLHNNTSNLKSYEGTQILWLEEAQTTSKKSWIDIDPTIRWDLKDEEGNTRIHEPTGLPVKAAEIWVTYNPDDELDPTHKKFVINTLSDAYVCQTSWRDADEYGWFPEALRKQKDEMKEKDYRMYLNVWEGEANTDFEEAIIKPEWVMAALDAHIKLNWEPLGAIVSAFDPADTNDDKALAIRHGFLITHVEAWNKKDLKWAVDRAYSVSRDHQVQTMVYDADGMGTGLQLTVEQKEKEHLLKATPFKGGMGVEYPDDPYPEIDYNKPLPDRVITNKQSFKNKRAQYYCFLRDRFENTYNAIHNNLYIDPDKCISISSSIPEADFTKLRSELVRIRRKKGGNESLITLESKQDMKEYSPGMADCVMMLFANPPVYNNNIKFNFKSDW